MFAKLITSAISWSTKPKCILLTCCAHPSDLCIASRQPASPALHQGWMHHHQAKGPKSRADQMQIMVRSTSLPANCFNLCRGRMRKNSRQTKLTADLRYCSFLPLVLSLHPYSNSAKKKTTLILNRELCRMWRIAVKSLSRQNPHPKAGLRQGFCSRLFWRSSFAKLQHYLQITRLWAILF